jgi:hypothetical protein
MTPAVALASIGVFIAALCLLGIVGRAGAALAVTRGAVAALRDPGLDDEARERAVQRASLKLFSAFLSILARSVLALLLSFAPIWLADAAGLAAQDEVLFYLSRWDNIVVVTIVMLAGYRLRMLLWASS